MPDSNRYVYRTRGVCPREIHFKIQGGRLAGVRFVGGGCPGNAVLAGRLLAGLAIEEAGMLLEGIDCRNGTSCPDQLGRAIRAVQQGELAPAQSFRLCTEPESRPQAVVVGALDGDSAVLPALTAAIQAAGVSDVYCFGNLTGRGGHNAACIRHVRKAGWHAIAGELDWLYANSREPEEFEPLAPAERDFLLQLPQLRVFRIGTRSAAAFFGDYVRRLPGFSDFEPYALELNMVCDLTRFMQDESVFPALAAMTPQFSAAAVLFSETRQWGRWEAGGIDFFAVGSVAGAEQPAWGLLTARADGIALEIEPIPAA